MKFLNKFYEGMIRLVIHVLENQRISKVEALLIVVLNNMLEIGILFSNKFNYPSANTLYVQIIFVYSQFFNTTQLLEKIGINSTALPLIIFLMAICSCLFVLMGVVYYNFYRGRPASNINRFILVTFEIILKYVGYCLAIPFLHVFITCIGVGVAETVLSVIGIALISVPLVIERYLIQEDNFVDTHYLCKYNTSLNLYNVLYFVFIMIFESHFATPAHRLPYTLCAFLWQIYRLYRLFTIDYYYFGTVQRLNILMKSVIAPISLIFLVNYILPYVNNSRTLCPTEWMVILILPCKMLMALHSSYEKWLLKNYKNLQNGYQVDRVAKLLSNKSMLHLNRTGTEFDYSKSDLLSVDVLTHKGIIASDYLESYSKKTFSKVWRHEELYDPYTFSFFQPEWRSQRRKPVKETPSNSIIAMKHFIRVLYDSYAAKFPRSSGLRFNAASFLLNYLRLTPGVIISCYILSGVISKHPDLRLSISRERLVRVVNTIQERLARERSDVIFSNIDIKGIAELETHFKEMQAMINVYVHKYLDFIDVMVEDTVVFENAFKIGKELLTLRGKTAAIYHGHLSENPLSMGIYSEFLKIVLNEDVEAADIVKKMQRTLAKVESFNRLEKDLVEVNLLYDQSSSILQASGLSETLGKILKANSGCEKLFGYSTKDLENMNIRALTPRLISQHHDRFLRNYLESGRENIIYSNKRFFARSKQGFIFPIMMLVKPQIDFSNGTFLFLSYMKSISTKNEFILTDRRGIIDSVSERLGKALGLNATFLQENIVQIQLICPETADLFEKPADTLKATDTSLRQRALTSDEDSDDGAKSHKDARARLLEKSELTLKMIKTPNPQDYVSIPAKSGKERALFDRTSGGAYTSTERDSGGARDSEDLSVGDITKTLLPALRSKLSVARKSKTFCLVQGAVEEYTSSKKTVKMYFFKFTDIEDFINNRIKRPKSTLHEKANSGRSKGTLASTIEKSTSGLTSLNTNKLGKSNTGQFEFKRTKTDYKKAKSLKKASLTGLKEDIENENLASRSKIDDSDMLTDGEKGLEELMQNKKSPRLFNDLSAIYPPGQANQDANDNSDGEKPFGPTPKKFLDVNNINTNVMHEANMSFVSSERGGNNDSSYLETIPRRVRYEDEKEDEPSALNTDRVFGNKGGTGLNDTSFADGPPNSSRMSTSRQLEALLSARRGLLESARGEPAGRGVKPLEERNDGGDTSRIRIAENEKVIKKTLKNEAEGDQQEPSEENSQASDAAVESGTNSKVSVSKEDLDAMKNNKEKEEGNTLDPANIIQKRINRSQSSSVTSGTYAAKMTLHAIFTPYYPVEFRQSQLVMMLQLGSALLALIVIISFCLNTFVGFRNSSQVLDEINHLPYTIHKLASTCYDLLNIAEILRDTEEGVQTKSTQTLSTLNDSLTQYTQQLYTFQTTQVYLDAVFPNFRDTILNTQVTVSPEYGITIPMIQFFNHIMLNGLTMMENFNNIVISKDVTTVNTMISDYAKVLPIILNWRDYFVANAVVDTGLPDKVTYETVAIAPILFVLTVYAIWKLVKSLKFINRTLYQLSNVSPAEYTDIRNRIVSARKYFGGADLTKRGTFHGKDKFHHKGSANKRRMEEARTNPIRRGAPIFLLFSFYMIIQGAFKAVEDATSENVKKGITNVLFYANDEANAAYGIAIYKNYTLYTRRNQTSDSEESALQSYFQGRFESITKQYTSAVETVQEIFPKDQMDELLNLIYGNTCKVYSDEAYNCTSVLSGAFEQGLITGRIAIINGMAKDADISSYPIDKYFTFREFNQADDIAHDIQLRMLEISSSRVLDIIDEAITTLSSLLAGLVLASVVFFWFLWSYTVNDVKNDFNKSRQLLSLLPVLYIHKNSRIMAFLKQTSSISLGKYQK